MRHPIMMDTSACARNLWSRILREAEEAAAREHVLAPLIADCIFSRANLSDAVCCLVAGRLGPSVAAPPLLTALRLFVAEEAAILAPASADIAAFLERDPATTKALHVLLHAKGFLPLHLQVR